MALNEWDKQILSKEDQKKIEQITKEWQKAYDAGKMDLADYWHLQAEEIRQEAGYTGGLWGNQPEVKKKEKTVTTTSGVPVGAPVDNAANLKTYNTADVSKNPIVPFPMDENTSRIVKIGLAVFGIGLLASFLSR